MRYYIITGESSGDMHAANLVNALKKNDKNTIVRAWGGDRLISEGASIAKHIRETAFMGLWSVFRNLRAINSNISFCKKDLLMFKPDALILVDYAGFNLRIAKFARENKLKVFYYIPPKLWAWNKSRVTKIKKFVDHLLVIFPFEVEFYKCQGIDAFYVGNPLLDEIAKKDYVLSIETSKPIIALLPGSRKQEIKAILPEMLKVVDSFPNYQFVIAGTNIFTDKFYRSFINYKNVKLVYDETYGLLSNASAALVASGTATLETALFNVPQIVCYKTNWLTYVIAKSFIKIEYLSLVNILLNKAVVKELIQTTLNRKNLKEGLDIILDEKDAILNDYARLRRLIGKKGASENAARFLTASI